MIIYENTVDNFLNSIRNRSLVTFMMDEYYRRVSRKLSLEAKNRWKYTMEILKQLVENVDINGECGIRIDYVVLEKFNRFEVLLAGYDESGKIKIGQISLFTWEEIRHSDKADFILYTENGEDYIEGLHPSFQSITYKKYLVRDKKDINIKSLVYMFECSNRSYERQLLGSEKNLVKEAPVFFADDFAALEEQILEYKDLKQGLLALNILHSADHLSGKSAELFFAELSKDISNVEFSQDQAFTIATISSTVESGEPSLIIIDGDPGTGKTMTAITAMVKLQKKGYRTCYISSAYVQSSMLREQARESFGEELYINDAESFIRRKPLDFTDIDVLFIDEAQNLFSKSIFEKDIHLNSRFNNLFGEIRVIVIIHSSSQMIEGKEKGKALFEEKAREVDKKIIYRYLSSNVRFSGKGSGVRWLAHHLQVANTENFEDWDYESYKIELVERPEDLRESLENKDGYKRILVNANKTNGLKRDSKGRFYYRLEKEKFEIPMHMKSDWLSCDNELEILQ